MGGEFNYISKIFDLGTRWKWAVSFTPRRKTAGNHSIMGWVGPDPVLDSVSEKVKKGNVVPVLN
jgi:hypothetical protein